MQIWHFINICLHPWTRLALPLYGSIRQYWHGSTGLLSVQYTCDNGLRKVILSIIFPLPLLLAVVGSLFSLCVHLLWYIGQKIEIIYNLTVHMERRLVNWKMNRRKWNQVKNQRIRLRLSAPRLNDYPDATDSNLRSAAEGLTITLIHPSVWIPLAFHK